VDDKKAGPDSVDLLAALLGKSKTGRERLVEHANTLALREGAWKFIEPKQGAKRSRNTNVELGNDPQPQLYNLAEDPGETKNLAGAEPEKVAQLAKQLTETRQRADAATLGK
jgi:arylsulfatase A-like enzyme